MAVDSKLKHEMKLKNKHVKNNGDDPITLIKGHSSPGEKAINEKPSKSKTETNEKPSKNKTEINEKLSKNKTEINEKPSKNKTEINEKPSKNKTEINEKNKNEKRLQKKARGKRSPTAVGADGKDGDDTLLQDTGFTIYILPPDKASFEIQVSSMELVQEIHQLLMDREDTCQRTCFSLTLEDITLDNFAELKSIDGLKEGSMLKVVERPYTTREARLHVRHVKDLLKSLDSADAYNGVDCASLSFLNAVTIGDVLDDRRVSSARSVVAAKRRNAASLDCTPPSYMLPSCKERPLLPLHPVLNKQKQPKCIKVVNMSGWNPPPGPRKMHGDLLYLYVVTMEGKLHHITASSCGFYVNRSTDDDFNPKPASPSHLNHSLIDLLKVLSPTFKRHFSNMQKRRTGRHPFERVPTPYQVHTWVSPVLEHDVDSLRAEDAFSAKLGYEEHIPGQTRDWNEELQTTRELARVTLHDRLLRERAIFKVHSDFVSAATRGAMAVVDGNVMAINPGEEARMQMFIWNNIFFSLGFDVKDHYKEVGGDAAAFVAPKNDLQGVKVYSHVDLSGLYTLGTVVVDYRGFRVTAQSIIPGILEREQEQSVVYGSIDFGRTVVTEKRYSELLREAGKALRIQPHNVLDHEGESVELCSSIECKGIVGNDGRHYILDLLRTFPPDVNFLPDEEGIEVSEACKQMGFPIRHCHKLATLRQELVDAFVDYRYVMFLKHASLQLQKMAAADSKVPLKEEDVGEEAKEEAKRLVEKASSPAEGEKGPEGRTKAVIREAAAAVGSTKECEFDVSFNPDVFSAGVRHPQDAASQEVLKTQRQRVVDAADFLVTMQLPTLVRDLKDHAAAPADGTGLVEAMHGHGINVRYLGKVASLVAESEKLSYVYTIAVSELVTRAVKHLFTDYVQRVQTMRLSAAVAHFLNCLLSASSLPQPPCSSDELQPVKPAVDDEEWVKLTPKTLWARIRQEVKDYFGFDLAHDCDSETMSATYSIQKMSVLRSFCYKCGVQLLLRNYNLELTEELSFRDEDILNLFPVVKHVHPKATDASNLFTAGQNKIQQGFLKEGYELINEALALLNNVYGAMHAEIAQCLRMLARINYIMGDYGEAFTFQQKAALMSERVNGVDSAQTVTEYVHLALYCFANQQVSIALRLLYRARYLLLLIHGELHPEVALVDANIGLILHAVSQYSLSLQFLEKALELNKRFYGSRSLKVALGYHLVARTLSCMGDFRSALRNEKETFCIYREQLGANHDKTREADECLRHLTQQAVVMAKKMNEASEGGRLSVAMGMAPIQIQAPSMANVLELLNVINGILYIQVTQAEIEHMRRELEKSSSNSSIGNKKKKGGKKKDESASTTEIEDASSDGSTPSQGGEEAKQKKKKVTDDEDDAASR